MTWAKDGPHPPLSEACRAPVTAAALQARREHVHRRKAEKGKREKFEDIHFWPIVVRENILDAPAAL